MFTALKAVESDLYLLILRSAIHRKDMGIPFDITLDFAIRKCHILQKVRRKKFVRRKVKSEPLFELSLIKERYPEVMMILNLLKAINAVISSKKDLRNLGCGFAK